MIPFGFIILKFLAFLPLSWGVIVAIAVICWIIASKMKLGFDTTLVLSVPILLGLASVIIGFSAIYSIIIIIAGTLLALGFSRLIGNR
jgi:hypothetical protein